MILVFINIEIIKRHLRKTVVDFVFGINIYIYKPTIKF